MLQTEIRTDDTLREVQNHGTPEFPFAFYDETVQQYRKGYIDWHWNSELEWLRVEQGVLDYRTADTTVRLQAGDGLGDERRPAEEGGELFGAGVGGERPEAFAAAAGQDEGVEMCGVHGVRG